MNSCTASDQKDYSADLNSLGTLESIVKELPLTLHMKWAKTFRRVTADGRETTFTESTEFISSSAGILFSRFEQIATRCQ
ncbi:hypothetical protein Smp_138790 [Schistosoma mansoni]|uniref:hypothetical protein n=1 Tax=Schistosoma mansoni TaxID=6183 RepID=UPI0001A64328|nr:hypothetical protein Smp_138790 [Schistosoma mansoni]|eukprot:XP_018648793.1 hypothetical protein Smp_138790 [Schistosoma mansoni]